MAMGGAAVLARALSGCGGDVRGALQRYERAFRPEVERIQASARQFAAYFVPETGWKAFVRDLSIRMMEWPGRGGCCAGSPPGRSCRNGCWPRRRPPLQQGDEVHSDGPDRRPGHLREVRAERPRADPRNPPVPPDGPSALLNGRNPGALAAVSGLRAEMGREGLGL